MVASIDSTRKHIKYKKFFFHKLNVLVWWNSYCSKERHIDCRFLSKSYAKPNLTLTRQISQKYHKDSFVGIISLRVKILSGLTAEGISLRFVPIVVIEKAQLFVRSKNNRRRESHYCCKFVTRVYVSIPVSKYFVQNYIIEQFYKVLL